MIHYLARTHILSKVGYYQSMGWDVETSNQDDKDYVMFFVDATTTMSTATPNVAKGPAVTPQSFYFQARQKS